MNCDFNHIMLWLLIVLATIISFLSIFLSLRLVKKFDEFELITSNAIEILNNERINLLKQVEILYRRGRILNNETKENNRKRNK